MLLGCFAVFWTIYYMLEVFLSRNKAALDLAACSSAHACWSNRGRATLSLEDGAAMEEAVPLYAGEDLAVETETEQLQASQEGQKGPRRGEAC